MVECTRLESEQTFTGLGSSNLPLSESKLVSKTRPRVQRRAAALLLAVFAYCFAVGGGRADAQTYRLAIVSLASTPRAERVHVTFGPHTDDAASASPPIADPKRALVDAAPEFAPRHGHVGDRRTFWVERFDPTGRNKDVTWGQVFATLRFTTDHADIWIDDNLGTIDPALEAALPRDVENAYLSQRGHFGPLSYTGGDVSKHGLINACDFARRIVGQVPAFVPSNGELLSFLIVGSSEAMNGGALVNSYRYQANLNCYARTIHSNEMPGLVVWPFERRRPAELQDGTLVYAPELQHLQRFVRGTIRGFRSEQLMPLLNEGLSELSQDFAVTALFGRPYDLFGAGDAARVYLSDPNAVSLLSFSLNNGREAHPFGTACYGGAYLLQRFLYDRFGDNYLTAVTNTDSGGIKAMQDALPIALSEALREFGRYLIAPDGSPYVSGLFNLYAHTQDEVGRPYETRGAALRPLPGPDFDVLGGSVSIYSSNAPIASVHADGAPIVWTELSDSDSSSS